MATLIDSTVRANAWIGTLNNPIEEERVALRTQQRWLKSCKGQDEIASTGTLHIQFMIHTDQIRLSTLKGWLSRAHFEPVRSAQHKANADAYVNKDATSVAGTQFHYVWRGETDKLSVNKLLIALYNIRSELTGEQLCAIETGKKPDTAYADTATTSDKTDPQRLYYYVMNRYLEENPEHVMMFGNRMVKELWLNCQPAIRSWWEADRQTTLTVNLVPATPEPPVPSYLQPPPWTPDQDEVQTDRQTPSASPAPAILLSDISDHITAHIAQLPGKQRYRLKLKSKD